MSVAAPPPAIDLLAINTIRTLSMDAVQKANSGHPGTPMALAPLAYQIWQHNLRYDPSQPLWPARDRFVLSCGHASMLLYSVLHLAGVRKVAKHDHKLEEGLAITLEDIKNFRQLHSPCAGHPEFGEAAGIETTTGPLGQGVGTSVGMAMAAKWLAAHYNRPGFELFENRVYVLCSDGDLMEGISGEAASTAGHLKLNNLTWFYDDNHITIEGETELAFSEDVATRFEGYGWNAIRVDDAHDLAAIQRAIDSAKKIADKPTIVIVRSIIGYGAPHKANTHAAHGAPLGAEEVAKQYNLSGFRGTHAIGHVRCTNGRRRLAVMSRFLDQLLRTAVAPLVQIRGQIVRGNKNWTPMTIYGTTPDYLVVRDWNGMDSGVMFTDQDVRGSVKSCVIGTTIARELFEGESPIGQPLHW
jgi:transketolase